MDSKFLKNQILGVLYFCIIIVYELYITFLQRKITKIDFCFTVVNQNNILIVLPIV